MKSIIGILTLLSVFAVSPLLAEDGVLIYTSEYLSDPVGDGHRVTVFQESEKLQDGSAKLVLDPNGCGLNQFGDTTFCTLMAPQVIDCELKAKKLADPLELDRTVFEVISNDFALPGRMSLVTGTESGIPTRLVIDSETAESRRRVVPLFKIDPEIALLGNNTVPILTADQPLAMSTATEAGSDGATPNNGTAIISSILRSRNSMTNFEQVYTVDQLEGRQKEGKAVIQATGTVTTSGWSNPTLSPVIYVVEPKNGIWEYQFVAESPGGSITNPVITKLTTPEVSINLHKKMKGVRVTAQQGEMLLRFVPTIPEAPKPMDHVAVNDVSIDGNIVKIKTLYSGGCTEHDFQLSWDGTYLESNPPQVRMRLIHNANDDACDGLIRETQSFLLPQLDPCIIRIDTGDGNTHEVPYGLN